MARSRLPARLMAVAALAAGAVVLVVILTSGPAAERAGQQGEAAIEQGQGGQDGRQRPARYVVQNGDTLVDIAEKTGVSVSRLQELNPGIDPQLLRSGQTLRLR